MVSGKLPRVGVLGASGYTGAELVRLLAIHRGVELVALVGDRKAGRPIWQVFPHLTGYQLPELISFEQLDISGLDLLFCALPHGASQEAIVALPQSLRVIDLSADFRLRSSEAYAQWYGREHIAPHFKAVYGLTEWYRSAIQQARLVANPGCYPTAALLALIPLVRAGMIDNQSIIIDAKSGISGAGREPKMSSMFCEVGEGVSPYGLGWHRHMPEIEQQLADFGAQKEVRVSFTPHLVPVSRGELVTVYVRTLVDFDLVRAELQRSYAGELFVHLVPEGTAVRTQDVRGSNRCLIGVFADRRPGWAIVLSAIDNLLKGAAGQAVQNMNIMLGFEENCGLTQLPLFP